MFSEVCFYIKLNFKQFVVNVGLVFLVDKYKEQRIERERSFVDKLLLHEQTGEQFDNSKGQKKGDCFDS